MQVITIIFVFVNIVISVQANCQGQSHVIQNNKEYRLFHTMANSSEAANKCRLWGLEWNSPREATLVQEITEELQMCLREMIESQQDARLLPNYLIGGEKKMSPSGGFTWKWKSGRKIALRGETNSSYQKWAPNRPFNVSTAKCLSALKNFEGRREVKVGDWMEQNCDEEIYFICQRDISEDLVWGFSNNDHAVKPENWQNLPNSAVCSQGNRQSPQDVPEIPFVYCNDPDGNRIYGWYTDNGTNVQWVARNTGRMVEIRFNPPHILYTFLEPNRTKQYVEYVHLKWGSGRDDGAEHTIAGIQHAGELQIFHYPLRNGERHAIAFLIEELGSVPNSKWNSLLSTILDTPKIHNRASMNAPKGQFKSLLEGHNQHAGKILRAGFRYRGSLTHPPCTENVIWTVYSNPIRLSQQQFKPLRHNMYIEGRKNGRLRNMILTTRPLQSRQSHFCRVSPD